MQCNYYCMHIYIIIIICITTQTYHMSIEHGMNVNIQDTLCSYPKYDVLLLTHPPMHSNNQFFNSAKQHKEYGSRKHTVASIYYFQIIMFELMTNPVKRFVTSIHKTYTVPCSYRIYNCTYCALQRMSTLCKIQLRRNEHDSTCTLSTHWI